MNREIIPWLTHPRNKRWRKSNKILPPEGMYVLAYSDGEIYVAYNTDGLGWRNAYHNRLYEPTHWKPLPKTPIIKK